MTYPYWYCTAAVDEAKDKEGRPMVGRSPGSWTHIHTYGKAMMIARLPQGGAACMRAVIKHRQGGSVYIVA